MIRLAFLIIRNICFSLSLYLFVFFIIHLLSLPYYTFAFLYHKKQFLLLIIRSIIFSSSSDAFTFTYLMMNLLSLIIKMHLLSFFKPFKVPLLLLITDTFVFIYHRVHLLIIIRYMRSSLSIETFDFPYQQKHLISHINRNICVPLS